MIEMIAQSIERGNGRVASCKAAGVRYQTFLDAINPEHKNYSLEFADIIKKAEMQGSQVIKETCLTVIIKAATDSEKPIWQAAAWLLERMFPAEFGAKRTLDAIINNNDLRSITVHFETQHTKHENAPN